MRFSTIRRVIAPSLLVCAAGCGDVEQLDELDAGNADAGNPDASTVDADNGDDDARPLGAPPINMVSAGTAVEGATLSLATLLVTTDADTASTSLVYTVSSLPADGVLKLGGVDLGVGSTFTQADVDEGRLTYVHDGAENASDSFGWTVSDGEQTVPATGSTPFAIAVTPVNDTPVIVNNPLTNVAEGATFVLTTAKLLTSDAEGTTLTYTLVTAATRGSLQKRPTGGSFTTMAAGATFTQQDIVAGNVQFVDSGIDDAALAAGNNTASSFSWRVTDAEGGQNPAVGANVTSFTITAVDDAPTLTWRALGCQVANTARPANPVVTLTDVDTPINQYSICVVSIGDGTSVVFNGTTTTGTTITVTPVLKNGAATLGVQSCVVANALSGLTFTSAGTQYGGNVTWRLLKSNVQIGVNGLMEFVFSTPPC